MTTIFINPDKLEPNDMKTPKQLKTGSAIFMLVLKVAMISQAIFGFLALLWVLIQLDTLGPWNIAISQSIIMGLLWVALLVLAIWGGKNLSADRMEALVQFLTYYTAIYTVTVFWEWFYLKLNYANATHWHPPPETDDAFMGYMAFCIMQIIFSFFFQIFALQLLNSDEKVVTGLMRWIGMNRSQNVGLVISFKAFTIGTQLVGFFLSWVYFFFLTGNPFSDARTQMWLFISFGILYVVQLMLFWALSRKRDVATDDASSITEALTFNKPFFSRHWDELDSVQMFLFIIFVINLAVWITIWSNSAHDFSNAYKFGTGAPNYYAYVGAGIFNSILLPWYGYYLVSSICFAEWIVSSNDRVEYDLGAIGPKSLFTVLFHTEDISQITITKTDNQEVTESTYADVPAGGWRTALQVVLSIGLIFQFVFAVFVLITLINKTFLGHFWFEWQIVFICVEGFFWLVYAIKCMTMAFSIGGEHAFHKNMIVFCTFFRPLLTFSICIFVVAYGFFELYRVNGTNHDISSATINDPTNFAWVKYWSLLTISLGVSLALVLIFKDMIGSLLTGASTFSVPVSNSVKAEMRVLTKADAYSHLSSGNKYASVSSITSGRENS